MESYLGLRLKLSFKDGSSANGTVNFINETSQKLSLTEGTKNGTLKNNVN